MIVCTTRTTFKTPNFFANASHILLSFTSLQSLATLPLTPLLELQRYKYLTNK